MSQSARRAVLQPGMMLGGYRLERVLGEGGMGVVWQVHDADLDRRIAVKVLRNEDAGLLREARAMARLKHPNVLVVYEVGTDGSATSSRWSSSRARMRRVWCIATSSQG